MSSMYAARRMSGGVAAGVGIRFAGAAIGSAAVTVG